MHLPAEVPVVTLVVSAAVLFASTALLTRSIPSVGWPRWRWRRRPKPRPSGRLAITGRTPALPAGPITAVTARFPVEPPRQAPHLVDVPEPPAGLADAQATIEHLLETDPERLARVMMQWIRDDDERREARR